MRCADIRELDEIKAVMTTETMSTTSSTSFFFPLLTKPPHPSPLTPAPTPAPTNPPHLCPCPQLSFPVLRASALLEKLWCCLGLTMATSSERGAAQAPGALPPPLPPPPPEEVAAFYALVEKRVTASVLRRHARCAELCEQAAKDAERLWGNNILVVADLRAGEACSLRQMARVSTSSSEKEALRRRAWAILVPVHALLLRRLSDNTLLPGTIKEEEMTYSSRSQAFACKAHDKPVPSEAVLQGLDTQRCWTPSSLRWLCSPSYEALGCRGRVRTPLF